MDKIENDEEISSIGEDIQSDEKMAGKVRPFLKWAGGKYKIVETLKNKFPKKAKRYIEPFLGAGSVALNIDYPQIIVGDTNADLMLVWEIFKDMGMDFVTECKKVFVPANNKDDKYYELRDEFNKTKKELRKAVLFIYLNRHCFNGLCRYNADGMYNVPKGKYKDPVYFPQDEFQKALEQVKRFDIHNKDFREVFEMVGKDDVVYCDPPYLPMSQSASFDTYTEGGFSLKDQIDLAQCAEVAAEKGATVVISNHYNWYSKQLYTHLCKGRVSKIAVSRTISAKTDKRDAVEEIVAVFQQDKNNTQSA